MAATAPLSPAAASALSAFLRGAERRALVVAELQVGDADVGERAVAVAMRAFAGHAAALPMADWPARFWGLLCSTPQLLNPTATGRWLPELSHLAQMAPAERLALLLRIGGGLDEASAAGVLGVDEGAYRQALAGACPLDAQGYPDAAAWRALAEQVQLEVRDLPVARLQQLAQLRDSVAPAARPAEPMTAPARPASASKPAPERKRATRQRNTAQSGSRRWWWIAGVLLLLIAIAGGWWHSGGLGQLFGTGTPEAKEGVLMDAGPVKVEELSDSSEPAGPAAADVHAASDAAMLADPDMAVARDADFYAWYAAGGPLPVDESQTQPTHAEPAAADLETVDSDE